MGRRHVPVSAMVKAPLSLMAFFAAAATIFVSACTWKEAHHRLARHPDPHATPAGQQAVAKLLSHCPERMPEARFCLPHLHTATPVIHNFRRTCC